MKGWAVGLFLFVFLGLALMSINALSSNSKPFVIWEVDEVRVPVHHYDLIEVETPIFYPEYVEVEKEIIIPLEDWNSLDEVKAFLEQDDSDRHLYLISGEPFSGQCENKAFTLEDRAEAIGKRLETETLTRTEYIIYYGNDGGLNAWDRHMLCKALIDNDVWFVEPENDEIWLAFYLD